MKQFILLFATLLCLGCLLPILCYQLSTSAAGRSAAAQGEAQSSTDQGTLSLSDWWGAVGSDNTTDPAGQDSAAGSTTGQGDTAGAAGTQGSGAEGNATDGTTDSTYPTTSNTQTAATLAPVLIWDEGSGSVLTVSVRDYLIGAVASELAMTWPDEALKAQAVACHSYILYCKEHADTAALGGAYLSADPARRQGFMTDEVLQSYWGEAYPEHYTRLSALVDEVLDVVVLYQGEAAATSYYAISNGMTQTSEAVWGQALPYLISVESTADTNAEGYLSSVTYTEAQVESIFYTVFGIDTTAIAPSDYFGEIVFDAAGYVDTISLGGYATAGTLVRTAFSLRSSCFWVVYSAEDGLYTITTAGYGHGVGLSQWGAKFRADAGEDYASILAHYYPNTTLGSASALEAI